MATTPRLGLTKLEVGQASKEATINADLDIIDAAVSGNASGSIWARVYHNTTQSIANTTPTNLAFNSERYDTNVIHDNSTNNSRLTCKTAGVYLMSATVAFAVNATGTRMVSILINGTTSLASVHATAAVGGLTTRIVTTTIYPMAVNDYIEASVYQSSGGALNVDSGANYTPEFMMIRLGA